jgi:peptidoglycan/LPS O-acetylase OafA/YrhL
MHHIDCFHSFVNTGKWEPSQYYLWALGKYGVALFFMITAFLFWGKYAIKKVLTGYHSTEEGHSELRQWLYFHHLSL